MKRLLNKIIDKVINRLYQRLNGEFNRIEKNFIRRTNFTVNHQKSVQEIK